MCAAGPSAGHEPDETFCRHDLIPMRYLNIPQPESLRGSSFDPRLDLLRRSLPAILAASAAVLAMAAILPACVARAQTSPAAQNPAAPAAAATASTKTPANKLARPHSKPSPAQPASTASVVAPALPAAPPAPDWPAKQQPTDASVVWDSQGLRIVASNSSLAQILREVSTVTGAKIEGMGADQRVFGTYGPGAVRDVLSELLDGSGYNVLMVGDLGQGTPRQIILSAPPTGPAPPVPNTPAEEEPPPEQEAQQPEPPQPPPAQNVPPAQNGFTPGMPVRTPQQILQEMQQRQQQLQQMQQQQQQNNPQN
jgi:hypothetical protein